jgi:hypothetical protein
LWLRAVVAVVKALDKVVEVVLVVSEREHLLA